MIEFNQWMVVVNDWDWDDWRQNISSSNRGGYESLSFTKASEKINKSSTLNSLDELTKAGKDGVC